VRFFPPKRIDGMATSEVKPPLLVKTSPLPYIFHVRKLVPPVGIAMGRYVTRMRLSPLTVKSSTIHP
jgi:hypothetical protein